jgi:hypothetical protein
MTDFPVTSALIGLKSGMLRDSIICKLQAIIQDKLGSLNIHKYRTDIQLVQLTLEVLKNVGPEIGLNSEEKQDEIGFEILNGLFCYSPEEINVVQNQIKYLVNNKSIKKIKLSKRLWSSFLSWIQKKVL